MDGRPGVHGSLRGYVCMYGCVHVPAFARLAIPRPNPHPPLNKNGKFFVFFFFFFFRPRHGYKVRVGVGVGGEVHGRLYIRSRMNGHARPHSHT